MSNRKGVRSRRRGPIAVAGTALVVVSAVLVGCGSDKASATTTLEPVAKAGADPFSESMEIGPVTTLPSTVQAVSASVRGQMEPDPTSGGLQTEGSAPGLYGGTADAKRCDPDELVRFLAANPAKAKAWAGVIGIAPRAIASFVAKLTPVVLTSDTLVTNHGYRDGKATTVRSVLQAGTAVMVDQTGVPRVKCNCGNPLGPPSAEPIGTLEGTPWGSFAAGQVVTVSPGKPGTTLTVTDIETGEPTGIPLGAPTKPTDTTTTTSQRSTTTSRPQTTTTTSASAGPDAALRAVDWKNFSYAIDCDGTSPVPMVDGVWNDPYTGFDAGSVAGVVYGDLASIPGEQAMVSVLCIPGGTASSIMGYLFVFTMQDGEPVQVGDAVDSRVDAQVIGGELVTDDDEFAPSDPACCPSLHVRHTWTLANGTWTPDPPR